MNTSRTRRALRGLGIATTLLAVGQASADDRDLLKFRAAKPYLFILLDTSASMNLTIGSDTPVPGDGDDPASRIWGAKEALFQVFRDVEDVHFGFATMNQDALRAPSYHWIYYLETIPGAWPFKGPGAAVTWPVADPDGLTVDRFTVDITGDGVGDIGDGSPDYDIEGDTLVFGRTFTNATGSPIPGGSCAAPIALDTEAGRRKVNAYALTGETGTETSTVWFQTGKGGAAKIYRLEVERPGNRPDGSSNAALGADDMHVLFRLAGPVASCTSIPAASIYNFAFRKDSGLNRFLMIDSGVAGSSSGSTEQYPGLWPWLDAHDVADCNDSHPHTGKGWEGNYDSGVQTGTMTFTDTDKYCADLDDDGTETCVELHPADQTEVSEFGATMDRGDVLPFDWRASGNNRDLMLQRLAPNWPEEFPDFGVASHLTGTADADIGSMLPRYANRPPLVARGDTTLNASVNDVRCWYMGKKGRNANGKCGHSTYFSDDGWSTTACVNDPDYGCRRPFLIVISDGHDVCRGNDATADVSDLSEFTGMKTWALNVGDPKGCRSGGGLHSIVNPGDGECVDVADKEDLKEVLKGLLAEIREQARSFATAAVPSVQATSDQAIYVSSFTPLNLKSVWDGHVNAFLKPMPVDDDGSPDVAVPCGPGVEGGCHLWDAGTAIESQFNASDPLGDNVNQRRVSYPLFQLGGTVPRTMRLFDPIDCDANLGACIDLLDGFVVPYAEEDLDAMTAAENEANLVITKTLAKKSHVMKNLDGTDGPTIQYLMGDLFHANPLVIGSPVNVSYWVGDLYGDGTECSDDESGNPGYRCFFERHRFRRKVLLAGANDGMLHAFDAGRFRESGLDPSTGRTLDHEFNNGTGKELFAFIPRSTLNTVKTQAEGTQHQYGVDGSPVAADVFIDAAHDGTPTPAERRWRTVVVGGLREGGVGYYGLDVTQPDKIKTSGELDVPIPDDNGASDWVPNCLTSYNPGHCGPNPYPSVLWEFNDTLDDSHVTSEVFGAMQMDEDRNSISDLGDGWSPANIGRIRVCRAGGTKCAASPANPEDGSDVLEMFVAIIGGGLDAEAVDKSLPSRGDWLYMLDIETGKLIYKRKLCSSASSVSCVTPGGVASEPAAVDINLDGYLDRIYVVTTGGFLFRVDLGPGSTGQLPNLTAQIVAGINPDNGLPLDVAVTRVRRDGPVSGELYWEPRAIFDANWNTDGATGATTATPKRRPLYQRPTVFFAALLDRFGVAFGTGDREDLWARTFQESRFYLFIDDTDEIASSALPLDEGDLVRVDVESSDIGEDLLLTRNPGQKGWYIPLETEERVITDAFSLSGVTIFSSFQPAIAITTDDCDPINDPDCDELETISCGEKEFEADTDNLCARAGISRNFVVGTTNADAFLFDVTGASTRYEAVSTFVTSPYSEPGQNKNPQNSGGSPTNADTLTALEIDVMDHLKDLFPDNCRFANYRVDIKTIAADTRVERIAPIPVCLVEKNWKEY